ncbi:hypothetical protein [Bradyrhizobium brasilense]|uniref:hypothetical protein n=1 Tax=Bradyrhizobium brasilense TaxID=1419277 RepID=UPI0011775A05|nr:hypothetical protein [Bradyrhizobium brasilense]
MIAPAVSVLLQTSERPGSMARRLAECLWLKRPNLTASSGLLACAHRSRDSGFVDMSMRLPGPLRSPLSPLDMQMLLLGGTGMSSRHLARSAPIMLPTVRAIVIMPIAIIPLLAHRPVPH